MGSGFLFANKMGIHAFVDRQHAGGKVCRVRNSAGNEMGALTK
jgi:hypothetical protein